MLFFFDRFYICILIKVGTFKCFFILYKFSFDFNLPDEKQRSSPRWYSRKLGPPWSSNLPLVSQHTRTPRCQGRPPQWSSCWNHVPIQVNKPAYVIKPRGATSSQWRPPAPLYDFIFKFLCLLGLLYLCK